jgi:hypothetical protein
LHEARAVNREQRPSEFLSPWPLLAVAVLVLNDHVLKARFHNGLTGKLSDFAGCFVLPLFVSAVLAQVTHWSVRARIGAGVVATLALFVPIKLSTLAAAFVARAIEVLSVPLGLGAQHIVADPSDLLAVPMVGVAAWLVLRRRAALELT